jgi:hypothetical protein
MGPSATFASRLMSLPENPGILVSREVQAKADKVYAFNALAPIKAKGIAEMVTIYEPLYTLERDFGRLLPNFVGRDSEIGEIVDAAKSISEGDGKARIFALYGKPGMGKSSASVHALEHIHKTIGTNYGRLFLAKTTCSETDKLVPFGTFSKLLLEVLDFHQGSTTGRRSTRRSVSALDPMDFATFSTMGERDKSNLSKHANRLEMIGKEMHAPPEFFELICKQLLGIGLFDEIIPERGTWTIESHTNLIDFLVCAFLRCVEKCKLSVLVFDDVDHMDELSSFIFRELFKRAPYLLMIVCTSSTSSPDKDHFLAVLLSDCQANVRFKAKRLIPFTDEEVSKMLSMTLGLQLADGVPELTRNIMLQSRGIPQVACAIIESMKHAMTDSMVRTLALGGSNMAPVSSCVLFADRMRSLGASVQEALGIGALYGLTFELSEIVSFLQQSENCTRKQLQQTIASLESAVEEDILYISEDVFEDGQKFQRNAHRSFASELFDSIDKSNGEPQKSIRFTFCNPLWRSTVIEMLTDSKRRELHNRIASSIQSRRPTDVHGFVSEAKVFMRWRAGGCKEQATKVALSLAESYERIGLHNMRILPLEDALRMWDGDDEKDDHTDDDMSSKDTVASMTQENLNALAVVDVKCQIQLLVAAGKSLKSDNQMRASIVAYQNALMIVSGAKAANDMEDFSIVFPVFDALLLAIALGHIEQDEERSFERALLARFVQVSFLHGDPIHRAQALALQAQAKARLGKFEKAIAVQQVLSQIYQPGEHSAGMIKLYGNDMAAQCLGLSALWYTQVEDTNAALAMCDYVSSTVLPFIGVRDAHKRMMIIYPLLWVLKDNARTLDAKDLFEKHVMGAFREGDLDSSLTPCAPIFEPILMLLNLSAGTATETDRLTYTEWALLEGNLQFGSELNSLMGHAGRYPDTISSEICLLLAKGNANAEDKSKLTLVGLAIAMETTSLAEEEGMIVAGSQAKSVYEGLVAMASKQDRISSDLIHAGDHHLVFI